MKDKQQQQMTVTDEHQQQMTVTDNQQQQMTVTNNQQHRQRRRSTAMIFISKHSLAHCCRNANWIRFRPFCHQIHNSWSLSELPPLPHQGRNIPGASDA